MNAKDSPAIPMAMQEDRALTESRQAPVSRVRGTGLAAMACAALLLLPGTAAAAPDTPASRLKAGPVSKLPKGVLDHLLKGGRVEIDLYGAEFVNWQSELSFYDTPNINASGRWRLVEVQPVWAKWELYKKANNAQGRVTLASGSFPSLPDDSADIALFKINLANYLPPHNNNATAQEYFLSVFSKTTPGGKPIEARRTKLIHLPKGQQVTPQPADPYACGSGVGKERRVTLEIPQLTVQKTTSTSGDGDRDELYITRARLGPGSYSGVMPRLPGADDYYEAKSGKTLKHGPSNSPPNIVPWTNQDEQFVDHPVLLNLVLKHGEIVDVEVNLSEQDNEELKDIKTGLITAFTGIAAVAGSVGGYGYIVAAVATAGAGASGLIPATAFHDQIAQFTVRFSNQCGYVQTVFVAPKSVDFGEAGKATMNFLDIQTHQSFNQRLSVLSIQDQFWPNGVEWGPYLPVGNADEVWMQANGTSQSKYTVLVRARAKAVE
ncbi:MAG: hypothetical protein AB1831_07805 [Pseudomonadota bacterium]